MSVPMAAFPIAILKAAGVGRVLNGEIGMTFPIERISIRADGTFFVLVRDYRYVEGNLPYQPWTLDGSEIALLGAS